MRLTQLITLDNAAEAADNAEDAIRHAIHLLKKVHPNNIGNYGYDKTELLEHLERALDCAAAVEQALDVVIFEAS